LIEPDIKRNFDADIVVAGAGPAGAAAACHLARLGVSVIVLDRATFPRDKVCGDLSGPLAVVELDALGVSQMNGYAETNISRRAALYLDGTELISLSLVDISEVPQSGRVIPRLVLDSLVVDAAKKAGARMMEGCSLAAFSADQDGVTINATGPDDGVTLRARLLIGADGSSSTVARIMRGSLPPRRDRMVAARAYFTGVAGPQDQLDVYIGSGCFPGYCWLFPTGNGQANVGLGFPVGTLPAHEESPALMLRQFMRDDPALAARLGNASLYGRIVGWPLMTYNHQLPIVADRVMLIGDAAGLINPLNGEGIQYALLSGRWAAETIATCLSADDFSQKALAPFASRVDSELGLDMALARLIFHYITNRALSPVWLQGLKIVTARARRDPEYARIVVGIFAGLTPARGSLNVRVAMGTLEQCVRTLSALGGPVRWAELGVDIARMGFNLAADATASPSSFVGWITSMTSCATELISQAVLSQVRSSRD
jgi:geranylgeranyl reductase family protein